MKRSAVVVVRCAVIFVAYHVVVGLVILNAATKPTERHKLKRTEHEVIIQIYCEEIGDPHNDVVIKFKLPGQDEPVEWFRQPTDILGETGAAEYCAGDGAEELGH